MPLKLVKLTFEELKIGAKFMAKIPYKKHRATLIKKWSTSAILEKSPTLMFSFKANDPVLVWRWIK
jgi:hypothetical protein